MANPATITTSSDNLKTGIVNLDANATQQLKDWADTSAPTSPSNGQTYTDNTVAARLVRKLRQDGAWVNLIGAHILEENLDCDSNELVNAIAEKLATGSLPTPSAATEARMTWDSTLERFVFTGSATQTYAAECNTDGTTFVRLPCSLNVATLGTPATASAATIYGGWLMDATAEEVNVIALEPVPTGYTTVTAGSKDITLEIDCLLAAAETANDDIDLDGTMEAISDGAAPGDDSVAVVAAVHDIGANAGQYDRHRVSLTFDYDLPSANVVAGDVLTAKLFHSVAGNIAGIIVVGAYWKVPVLNFGS